MLREWVHKQAVISLSLFLCLFCVFSFGKEGGRVRLQLTESLVSSLLSEALRNVDSSIRAEVNFKSGSGKDSSGKAVLVYRVFFSVPDLRLDSLDGVTGSSDTGPLQRALEELRSSLSSHGMSEISFQVGTKMSLKKGEDRIFINARLYPRTLRIHTKSLEQGKMDVLMNEVLRPLLVDRYLDQILSGIEEKYLKELQVGKLFTLRARDLAKNRLIRIEVDLGEVNQLNVLDFLNFSTTEKHLILTGRTNAPQREGK